VHEHKWLPRARKDGLLVDAVGDELLIYDQDRHIGHCLSPVAARVWRYCDGEREVSELAELAGASEDLVLGALHELRKKDLLVAEFQSTQGAVPGVSRREVIGQGVRYGAAAAAVPLIVSATAATPAMASSGEEDKCAATWSATATYAEDALVEYPANAIRCWGSNKPGNKGNVPALSSEWWTFVIGTCE
jgi:hypothetical protein